MFQQRSGVFSAKVLPKNNTAYSGFDVGLAQI